MEKKAETRVTMRHRGAMCHPVVGVVREEALVTKRELQAELVSARAEVAALRRERNAILAVLANAHIEPQQRILAVALAYWHGEQVPDAGGFVRLDAEEVARRAGTTPEAVQEQVELLASWGLLDAETRGAPAYVAGD